MDTKVHKKDDEGVLIESGQCCSIDNLCYL